MRLENIKFKWNGKKLSKIEASLYKRKKEKDDLIPLEDNIVSDGKWNPSNQEISFNLNEKLIAVNKYFLVVSYPKGLESHLKQGIFQPIEKIVEKE